ncbi:phosphotransferase family protein [Kitasatospora sp. NPDC058046]|uniref:phosphotransferase family protein n=1 Tax=Kitasatospora sp. NPDC058046 TaxID=3346312 RepID=UPI0036DE574F
MSHDAESRAILQDACTTVGLTGDHAVARRLAENEHWWIPPDLIARIGQPSQIDAEARAVLIARWLTTQGILTVVPLDATQPVVVNRRPVTFWHEVPVHEHGTVEDLAGVLRKLHAIAQPAFMLPQLDPLVRVRARLEAATTLPPQDAVWLLDLHDDLENQWADGVTSRYPACIVHGDAWPGNIVRTPQGPLVMDLERVAIGPREWDLVSTAVRTFTTGAVEIRDYQQFSQSYGYDVTAWDGYPLLSTTRELRITAYAAQHAATNPRWRNEAQLRVDCLRGRRGPRPWLWTGIM